MVKLKAASPFTTNESVDAGSINNLSVASLSISITEERSNPEKPDFSTVFTSFLFRIGFNFNESLNSTTFSPLSVVSLSSGTANVKLDPFFIFNFALTIGRLIGPFISILLSIIIRPKNSLFSFAVVLNNVKFFVLTFSENM